MPEHKIRKHRARRRQPMPPPKGRPRYQDEPNDARCEPGGRPCPRHAPTYYTGVAKHRLSLAVVTG